MRFSDRFDRFDTLLEGIEKNTTKTVSLDANLIEGAGSDRIVALRDAMLQSSVIEVIELSKLNLDNLGELSPALIGASHHTLRLRDCRGVIAHDRIFIDSRGNETREVELCQIGEYPHPRLPYVGPATVKSKLRCLSIHKHHFTDKKECSDIQYWIIQNTSLEKFEFVDCSEGIDAHGVIQYAILGILEALTLKESLVCLSLANTRLSMERDSIFDGYDYPKALEELLERNTALKEVNLSRCQFGESAGELFGCMLSKNTNIVSMDLSDNNFTPCALRFILYGLRNNKFLEKIALSGNLFSNPEVFKELTDIIINNKNLKHLLLDRTNILESNQKALYDSILRNVTLEQVSLEESQVRLEDQVAIKNAVQVNKRIKTQSKHRRIFQNIQLLLYYSNKAALKQEPDYAEVVVGEGDAVELHEIAPEFTSPLPLGVWLVIIEHVLKMEFPNAPAKLIGKIISDSLSFQERIIYDDKQGKLLIDPESSCKMEFNFFKLPDAPFVQRSVCSKFIKALDTLPVYELSHNLSCALAVKSILQDTDKDILSKTISVFQCYKRYKETFPILPEFPDLDKRLEMFDETLFLKPPEKKTYHQALKMLC